MFFESLPKFKALQLYQQEFMRAISQMAIADQRKNKICASLTVAQAILESRWGQSGLTVKANNLFGMKGSYKGQSYSCATSEYLHTEGKYIRITGVFKKYASWQESVDDHSGLFYRLDRYKNLRGCLDYKLATDYIQKDGYATCPTYTTKLRALIEAYQLFRLDEMAKAAPKTYTVLQGDTLWSIAAKQLKDGRRWTEIYALNGLKTKNISRGMVLELPQDAIIKTDPVTHTVVKGDNLYNLAQTYMGDGNKYKQIIALNSLKSNVLKVGQILKIPRV